MFVVLLTFSTNKAEAGTFMNGHREWIKQGMSDGVFLVVGSLEPDRGGAVLAHDTSLEALRKRVNEDPFVAEDVVSAEILEISPAMTDDRLAFLVE